MMTLQNMTGPSYTLARLSETGGKMSVWRTGAGVVVVVAALLLVVTPALGAERIVVVHDGADASAIASRNGIASPAQVYESVLDGFAADLTPAQQRRLERDPAVDSVEDDTTFRLADVDAPQIVGNGVRRIGGLLSPSARIDGLDDRRVDADIAIIDSGVDVTHPDLNLVGGVDCSRSGTFTDTLGHGTLVAGTAASIDNGIGTVGAAPGARVWAVRVVDKRGEIRQSSLICAVEWVAEHADVIDVANISIGGDDPEVGPCGRDRYGAVRDSLHAAICVAVGRGVTFAVAAGNEAQDAAGFIPAAYDEVITVSAYSDFDGRPGGRAAEACYDLPPLPEEDDTMAFFSNFGRDVDIAAPGVCIEGPVPGGYGVADGTSFSSPFVAGAAALVVAQTPGLSPAQVLATLLQRADRSPIPQDPDKFPEPLLSIATL
jgi:subtilisin